MIFAVLIIAFAFFYNTISFNPIDMSKNLQQNGGMIPGIRQGKPTSDYLARISRRITLFGALFLAVLAVVPTLIAALCGVSIPFGASSLLIAVSVALETTRRAGKPDVDASLQRILEVIHGGQAGSVGRFPALLAWAADVMR